MKHTKKSINNLSICIFNCYSKSYRKKRMDVHDLNQPSNLFKNFLQKYIPECNVDIIFTDDYKLMLPSGIHVNKYDGYIWTGSNLYDYNKNPIIKKQVELLQSIFEEGIPCYGSCWGIQLACVVAGGKVKKNKNGFEWNIARNIKKVNKQSLLLKGKPDTYDGLVFHEYEISKVPKNSIISSIGNHTSVQSLEINCKKGTFWGTQYHPEYNLYELNRWSITRAKYLVECDFFKEEKEVQKYVKKADTLYYNPKLTKLKKELNISRSILDDIIRQQELRNWIDYLVIPHKQGLR